MKQLLTKLAGGLALLFLLPLTVFAQEGSISGTVTDAETGEPLPGANVVIPEEQLGAATNVDGEYTITGVPAGTHTLRTTFIGYVADEREVSLSAGEALTVNIALESDAAALEEVVVTGLGIQRQRGTQQVSVSRVDASELTENANFQDVSQLISGNVAGVSAQQSSGNIGSGIRFQVRGGGGLTGSGQPAIYVDGTRIDNSEIEGFGAGGQGVSPLADLNPQDIESIEIIRGPAGAAIYGVDGSNGVVLITTKRGSYSSEPTMDVQYRGTFGWNEQNREYDEDVFGTADDANALFSRGPLQQHRVSVSGGMQNFSYFASLDNRREEGALPRNEGDRTSMRANFEVLPTEDVTIRANANYTINALERPDNDNNVQGYLGNTLLLPTSYLFTDSVAINRMEDVQQIERFVGSLSGSWSPIENLNLTATAGYDASTRRQDRTRPPGFFYAGIGTDGERNIFTRTNKQFNLDAQAQYNYALTEGLQATTLVGGQYTDRTLRTSFGTAQGFGTDDVRNAGAGADITSFDEDFTNTRTGGLFAQHEFVLNDTYFLSGMVRRDVASSLGEGVSSVLYPSVSAAVRLDQFDFMPDAITVLRPRIAYGETGSLPSLDDTEPLRFQATAAAVGSGGIISSVGDPNLEPERIRELEVGFDSDFLDRYSLEATYWFAFARNSIVDAPLAPSTGFGFQELPANVGEIESSGIEVTLGATPLLTENFRLDLDLTYGYQQSEVKDLGPDVDDIFGGFNRNVLKPGVSRQAFFLRPVNGPIFDEDGVFVGIDAGDEREEVGQPIPEHTGGIRLNLTLFQNLRLNAFAEYALGHQVFNNTLVFATDFGNNVRRNDLQERLGELEPGTEEYREVATELAFTSTQFDANFVEDADWLKMRELTLSYNFTDLIQRLNVSQVQALNLTVGARNLFTITEFQGPDPEVNFSGGRGLIRGQEFLTLETPRQFYTTVSVTF